jgi:hypothetical protein
VRHPIALTDAELLRYFRLVDHSPLTIATRFCELLLSNADELGRAIRDVQRLYFDPPNTHARSSSNTPDQCAQMHQHYSL